MRTCSLNCMNDSDGFWLRHIDGTMRHMRTTVRLSQDLLRRAKRKAADEGRTLTSVLEEGLKMVLTSSKPARRSRVQLPVSKMRGGTLPGVDLNRSSDLEDRLEGL